MTPREFILYADESVERGARFSNFFGGLLISSRDRSLVVSLLEAEKQRLHLHGEVKWQKVSLNYLDKYQHLTSLFLDLVRDGKARLRILFTDNSDHPDCLTALNFRGRYLLLYLAFIEHAFDIACRSPRAEPVRLRILLDQLPVPADDKRAFRQRLYRLNSGPVFRSGNVRVFPGDIGEVDSRDHVLLQCLDVVLGAMQSAMNSPGHRSSGNRSLARSHLSAHILRLVRSIHPDFQMEVTTPVASGEEWACCYRHLLYGPEGIET
ncbi:MAG: hypothetical protein OXF44_02530 [Anaerolineaceae bacterium]|nr:hypothetical protein [Anaerolineaceae bacterium]MCY4022243.1 hypothetical protein [Anaerolineaceae bacterium]